MPSGRVHEALNTVLLCIIITTLCFYKFMVQGVCEFALMWVIGTFYLSPDLDADYSRSKNRVGGFKRLFYFFHHRGTLHNPYLWTSVFLVFLYWGYGWIGAGLSGSALAHIILDQIL